MANFDLSNYIPVNDRVDKFWKKYPEGSIETEIVKWEKDVITMKAKVFKNASDTHPAATGHAYEKDGTGFVNKTSAVENCETSVVGRALAIMGFDVQKSIASKEEVANAILHQYEAIIKKLLMEKHKKDVKKAKAEFIRLTNPQPKQEEISGELTDEDKAEIDNSLDEEVA